MVGRADRRRFGASFRGLLACWFIVAACVLHWPVAGNAASLKVEEVFSFTGSPQSIRGLVEGDDGNLYGICDGGTRFDALHSYGFIFRVTMDGAASIIHRFDGTDGIEPVTLIKGFDGKMYGATSGADGGAPPTLFSLSAEGVVQTLHTFPQDERATVSAHRALVADADGTLYGDLPDGVFRLTVSGSFSTFIPFSVSCLAVTPDGIVCGIRQSRVIKFGADGSPVVLFVSSAPVESLRAGSDGKLYLSSALMEVGQPRYFTRVSLDGDVRQLFSGSRQDAVYLRQDAAGVYFATYFAPNVLNGIYRVNADDTVSPLKTYPLRGDSSAGQIVLFSRDGNYYSVRSPNSGPHEDLISANPVSDVINRISPDGTISLFAGDFTGEPSIPSGGLVRGSDGRLYGPAFQGGRYTRGSIYAFDPATSSVETIHALNPGDGANPAGRLEIDSAGRFYGMTLPRGSTSGRVFRCTEAGKFAICHTFPSGNAAWYPPLREMESSMAFGRDGALYGFYSSPTDARRRHFRLEQGGGYREAGASSYAGYYCQPVAAKDGTVCHYGMFPLTKEVNDITFTRSALGTGLPVTHSVGLRGSEIDSGPVALGRDGAFYGIADIGERTVFFQSTLPKGVPKPIRELFPSKESWENNGLALAQDGRFYGVISRMVEGSVRNLLFASSTEGGFRPIGEFASPVPIAGGPVDPKVRRGATLAEGGDGYLYGVYPDGGSRGGGFIYRTALSLGNSPPIAGDDAIEIAGKTATILSILANDTDVDGDRLFVRSVTQPASGSVSVAPGGTALLYTPGDTFAGSDRFTYTAVDGFGGGSTATVTVTNPFFAAAGVYDGVLADATGAIYGGYALALDAETGVLAGKVTILPPSPFAGTTNDVVAQLKLGSYTAEVVRPATDKLPATVRAFEFVPGEGLRTRFAEGTRSWSAYSIRRAATLPASVASGAYTFVFTPQNAAVSEPSGYGYATARIVGKGLISFSGMLPDGTKLSFGGVLDKKGRLPFLVSLYGKRGGYLGGTLNFANAKDGRELGVLRWVKHSQSGGPLPRLYARGFSLRLSVEGAIYSSQSGGAGAAGEYVFSAGYADALPMVTERVKLGPGGVPGASNVADACTLKFATIPSTGFFSGTFTHLGEKSAPVPFSGVFYQPECIGRGLFTGPEATGNVMLDQARVRR